MFSDHSRHAIIIGFITVMMLMIGVVVVGNTRMSDINRSMETIVNEHNVKTGYIITMYTAARERSVSLLRMVNMEDAFDRDEEYLHLNELATTFAVARIALNELGLDKAEAVFFSEQGKLTQASVPLQNAVVQLLIEEKVAEATRLLLDEAIPAQDLVLEQLTRMLAFQQLAAEHSCSQNGISAH